MRALTVMIASKKTCYSWKQLVPSRSRGASVVEVLPLLAVFIILFGLTFGFWNAIHSGMLQSISARHYAFEVLNNRTDFVYHRDTEAPEGEISYYRKTGYRFFAVVKSQPPVDLQLFSPKRELNLFNKGILEVNSASQGGGQANPIELQQAYGICIDLDCGGK